MQYKVVKYKHKHNNSILFEQQWFTAALIPQTNRCKDYISFNDTSFKVLFSHAQPNKNNKQVYWTYGSSFKLNLNQTTLTGCSSSSYL